MRPAASEPPRAGPLSGVPVILTTTGWADSDSRQFAREVGANALVDKTMVLDTLGTVLGVWGAEDRSGSLTVVEGIEGEPGAPAARLAEDEFRRRHGDRLLHLSLREAELLKQQREALAEAYRGTLGALASALELGGSGVAHARRVTGYVISIAEALGIGPQDPAVAQLVRTALLCDIGNLGIPQRILNKPGFLSSSEWRLLKTHPSLSAAAVEEVDKVRGVSDAVLSHHERWDGQGYPQGLVGPDIPFPARVVAVADTIDALTSDRPYRDPITFDQAAEEVLRCSETQFDPEVAEAASLIDAGEWALIREQAESANPTFHTMVAGYL